MEALEALRTEHPEMAGGEGVDEVLVEGSAMAMNFSNPDPSTTLAAKFSIPQAAAGTIVLGAADQSVFNAEGFRDPRIAAMRKRVRLAQLPEVKPWPYDRPAKVTVKLRDGRSLSRTCEAALGSPLRPLTPERVLEKIEKLSRRDAPGLAPSISRTRDVAAQGRLPELSCRDWIARFFRS
jgi:2-methylcitrate dehydratase PrpD